MCAYIYAPATTQLDFRGSNEATWCVKRLKTTYLKALIVHKYMLTDRQTHSYIYRRKRDCA